MAGPGARKTVPAPLRSAPTVSLLTLAERIVETDDHWLNGIQYRRERCGVGAALPVGCADAVEYPYTPEPYSPTKPVEADSQTVETDPFLVYTGDECSTFGFSANDYQGRARRELAAVESWQAEYEFWTGTQAQAGAIAGVDYPNDQWLAQVQTVEILNASDTADPNTATAVPPVNAAGLLQDALGDCRGGRGMIHVPSGGFPFLVATGQARREQGRWVDPQDNIIVPWNGYPGTSPDGSPPPDGATWVYATGLVTWRATEPVVVPDTFGEALDRTYNLVTYRAERYFLIDWDRCCHYAILMQTCTDSACADPPQAGAS